MSRHALCIGLGLAVSSLLGLLPLDASAKDVTELTVTEQVGSARTNEPIRMGVPLAKGVAKEVGELGLLDASGKRIDCQFKEVMRWPDDKSLRWVHVIFQASVPAKGSTTVKLVSGVLQVDAVAPRPGWVRVTEGKDAVTVTNGQVKFVIKGAGFNLFDGAWYDPAGANQFGQGTEVVKPGGEGIVATIDGKAYKPAADSKVEVEEKDLQAAVIKVSGKLVSDGQGPFEYVCRIHVFAGSPVVKVDFSYTNCQGKDAGDKVSMSDLSVVLPVAGDQASVGGEDKVYAGKLASIVAKTSDSSEISVDEKSAGTAKGKSTKPLTIGWADASGKDAGLAVGVRWFWQMFPKAMEAGNGKLRAALYAKEVGTPLDVYMGQGRTHYLTFLFHGKIEGPALSEFFAGTQMPLRALASPKYYCRDTQGFGKVADADPSLYPADVVDAEKKYDELLKTSAEKINKKIDSATFQGVTMDSYGYLAWGDLFHYANESGETNPWNILWESNYYDYPWACCLQFARTGDPMYLDILDRNGLHLADVFMCKWAPDHKYWGACRYSPPANFVGLDQDYKNPKPYFSVEFNHHKAQSILARYYLLGDLRAKDDFLLALNNAMTNPEASWRQSRGPGAKLATLYSGYLLTGDPQCLAKMKVCVDAGIAAVKKNTPYFLAEKRDGGLFMIGVSSEGLSYYWQLTGDAETLETIKAIGDFMVTKIDANKNKKDVVTTNITFALSLLYRQTGDEKYKRASLDQFSLSGIEMRPKGFGQHWRNCAYTWYYLSNLGAKEAPPGAGKP